MKLSIKSVMKIVIVLVAFVSIGVHNIYADERNSCTGNSEIDVSAMIDKLQAARQVLNDLAEEFDLTYAQKSQLRNILMTESPEALALASELMDNRRKLLNLTQGKTELDKAAVEEIAVAQGNLIVELILWKEALKADMRTVLTADQQGMLDQLFMRLREALAARQHSSSPIG